MSVRRLFLCGLFVVLALWAVPAHASLAVLNRAFGGATSTSTTVATNAQTHTAGNGLVALINVISIDGVPTGVANLAGGGSGDTWTFLATYTDGTGTFNRLDIYYVSSTLGAVNDVVTATLSPTTRFRTIAVYEISGQLASGMAGNTATGVGTSTAIATSGNVTVTATQEVIFAFGGSTGYPTSAGTGYTLVNWNIDGMSNFYYDEYHIVTASETPTATQTTGLTWVMLAASFKVATPVATGGGLLLTGVGK